MLGSFNQGDKITVDVVQRTVIVHELFEKGVVVCVLNSEGCVAQTLTIPTRHDDADRKGSPLLGERTREKVAKIRLSPSN